MALLFMLLSSLATTLVSQALVVMRPFAGLEWARSHPGAFFLTWFCLFGATLWVSLLAKSTRLAFSLIQGGFLFLGAVSFLKRRQFGMPLYPWDFSLAREFLAILPDFLKSSIEVTIGLCVVLAGGALLYRRFPQGLLRWKASRRWSAFAGLTLLFSVLFMANNPLHDFLFHGHFHAEIRRPQDGLRDNGLLIGFVLLKEQGEIYVPPGYSRAAFDQLLKTQETSRREPAGSAAERPDVIVVMSESLFDPLQLEGVRWKSDPLAFTRSLAPNRPLSLTVVPTFGGRTGNSEFEFLTGFSTSFFAKGTVPYIKYIDGPEPSLARTFRQAGYKTIAVHPGGRGSYNRAEVYSLFGFDEFHSRETLPGLENYGNQVSDESLLPFLKESLAKNTQPTFHFVVTIQNHYPYNPNPFQLADLPFETDGLSKDEQVVLNYYGKLLEATDRFHRDLVAYLQTRKRPTVLVIFGDHLPPLLPQFGLFKGRMVRSDDPDSWSSKEKLKMYSTPYLQWSNFPLPAEERPVQASFLGTRLLRKLNLKMPPFQNFVADWSDRHPVFKRDLLEDSEQVSQKEIDRYWIFQYGTFMHLTPPATGSLSADL